MITHGSVILGLFLNPEISTLAGKMAMMKAKLNQMLVGMSRNVL